MFDLAGLIYAGLAFVGVICFASILIGVCFWIEDRFF